jgi:2-keto-4-pentenoate hydratase
MNEMRIIARDAMTRNRTRRAVADAAFESLARSLADAWRRCATIPLPASDVAPRSRADAFAIQDRMAALVGDRCVGWKVGAAVRAVQILEGHDGPITGRLFASRLFQSPARISTGFDGYKIECELAFRFDDDVPARERAYSRADLEPRIALVAGLEIAGTRYAPGARAATTHDAIADKGAGGAYVAGERIDDWRRLDLETLAIDARIDKGAPIRVYAGDYRRDPVDVLIETVNGLRERGIGLAAGDLLSTGSLTLPTPLHPGQTYTARFGDVAALRVVMDAR